MESTQRASVLLQLNRLFINQHMRATLVATDVATNLIYFPFMVVAE